MTKILQRMMEYCRVKDERKFERRMVWAMSIGLVIMVAIPTATGYFYADKYGQQWSGMNVFVREDLLVYLSNIEQIRDGNWLINNNFTAEDSYPIFNPFWLMVGWFARLSGLEALTAFNIFKLLTIVPMIWVAHWSLRVFVRQTSERLAALGLLTFGAGLGWLNVSAKANPMNWPIDLWVPEVFVVRSPSYSPHLVMAWLLLIVVMTMMFIAYRDGRQGAAVKAGLAFLALTIFHPYHAPTVFWACGLAMVVMSVVDLKNFWRRLISYLTLVVMASPAIAYHWWLLQPERNGPHAFSGNICWTPELLYVLLGLGAFVPMAALGAYLWRQRRTAEDKMAGLFMLTWLVGQMVIIYAPTMLQRRFSQGLLFPLAVFSGLALMETWRWLGRSRSLSKPKRLAGMGIFVTLAFLMTPLTSIYLDLKTVRSSRAQDIYYTHDESAMFAWMRQNVPAKAVVLSSYRKGTTIPANTNLRSYLGHWGQTIDVRRKEAEVAKFYVTSGSTAWAEELLNTEHIDYIYRGRHEDTATADLPSFTFLEVAHREGEEVLYRVKKQE